MSQEITEGNAADGAAEAQAAAAQAAAQGHAGTPPGPSSNASECACSKKYDLCRVQLTVGIVDMSIADLAQFAREVREESEARNAAEIARVEQLEAQLQVLVRNWAAMRKKLELLRSVVCDLGV